MITVAIGAIGEVPLTGAVAIGAAAGVGIGVSIAACITSSSTGAAAATGTTIGGGGGVVARGGSGGGVGRADGFGSSTTSRSTLFNVGRNAIAGSGSAAGVSSVLSSTGAIGAATITGGAITDSAIDGGAIDGGVGSIGCAAARARATITSSSSGESCARYAITAASIAGAGAAFVDAGAGNDGGAMLGREGWRFGRGTDGRTLGEGRGTTRSEGEDLGMRSRGANGVPSRTEARLEALRALACTVHAGWIVQCGSPS